jgi:hypothetical protein
VFDGDIAIRYKDVMRIMTKIQFIKTVRGKGFAILPKSKYERLAKLIVDEDVGTARVVHNARNRIAAGREVIVPKAIVDRLAARRPRR